MPECGAGQSECVPGRAVVVGASSAIGAAVAVELAALGHEPVLWGRDAGRLEAARAACGGGRVDRVDVTDAGQVEAALARARDGAPVDVAVWAAGSFAWGPADAVDGAAWDAVLEVGLLAAARFARLVLPDLLAAAPSALVLVGSGAARRAYADNATHVAAKHGLAGLAGGLWLDVRDRGVKVSLVSPGLVAAGAGLRSPAGQERPDQLLQPEDVAAAVRFVVGFPARGCPVEVELQPQRTP